MPNTEQAIEQQTELQGLAEKLIGAVSKQNKRICTIESCTGGLISAHITGQEGSSTIFDRSFITYSNQSKIDLVNVNPETINKHSVFSEEVAIEMLLGGLNNSAADIGVAVTGIAGPNGGTKNMPVGSIFFAWGSNSKQVCASKVFTGSRSEIRDLAVSFSFNALLSFINNS